VESSEAVSSAERSQLGIPVRRVRLPLRRWCEEAHYDGIVAFSQKGLGTGHPIVFSHDWPLSADDWDTQMLFFLHTTECTEWIIPVIHDQVRKSDTLVRMIVASRLWRDPLSHLTSP
jgi:hypothetical protein